MIIPAITVKEEILLKEEDFKDIMAEGIKKYS